MEEFIKWFLNNWNANIFTLFTVLLSGIISLMISAAYYRKGNRNNLKMSVIHPIISILMIVIQEIIIRRWRKFQKNIV